MGSFASAMGGALPPFVVGAASLELSSALSLPVARVGGSVGAFFLAAFVASTPAGHLVDRIGWYRAVLAAGVVSSAMMAAMAFLPVSWLGLIILLVAGGAGHAIAMPASNVVLLRHVRPERQALGFGIKQCAMPAAGVFAGTAVPLLIVPLGWRWAFLAGSFVPLAALVLLTSLARDANVERPPRRRIQRPAALIVTAMGGSLAAMLVGVLGAFYVSSMVAAGLSQSMAGVALAVGGGLGIVTRIAGGWLAGRGASTGLAPVIALVALGAVGCLMIAGQSLAMALVGSVLLFGAGWGWSGLFHFAVVRANPLTPAAATGVILTGLSAGSTIGPVGFGVISERAGIATAWMTLSAVVAVGVALLVFVQRTHVDPRHAHAGDLT